MNDNVNPQSAISFTVTWDSSQYSINVTTVGANTSFKFLTENEIAFNAIWWNGQFDPSNTKSANDILKIDTPLAQTNSFISDFIQLQPINNVYITSPTLGSFDTIASFSNNVIRKVPITAVSYTHLTLPTIYSV